MRDLVAEHEKMRLEEYKKKLKDKLRELFQIGDVAEDLDFGIYRIVHQRRKDVETFIDETLDQTLDDVFGAYSNDARANSTVERETLERTIREEIDENAISSDGILPQFLNTKRARELNDNWKHLRTDESKATMSDQYKAEIFSHITEFFSRYYKEGDFLSLPRYSTKHEKYAIPYNGEEVILHWANKDQYYIKTDLWLNNYVFDIGSYKVIFEVCSTDSSVNTTNEKDLVFVLTRCDDAVSYDQEKKVLTLRFVRIKWRADAMGEYLPTGANREKPSKEHLRQAIVNNTIAKITDEGLKSALNRPAYPSRTDISITIFRKHVNQFTTESESDFFIHKDLRRFLSKELDFYIKNEVIALDDLGTGNEVQVDEMKQYLSRARIIKQICTYIIDFLAQLENFQKMLFEKKKFVIATDYCVTLDHVPDEFYDEILSNHKQLAEWKSLYGAGEGEQVVVGAVSRGITKEYIQTHQNLMIDTKFFDESFKIRLLSKLKHPNGVPIEDLDAETSGLMIHSENWQALNLLKRKYEEQVNSIYIDPPYNTDASPILYKNGYKNATWITLLNDRLECSKSYLQQNGILVAAIDDEQQKELGYLLSQIFDSNNLGTICVRSNPSGRPTQTGYSVSHEYLLFAGKTKQSNIGRMPPTPEQMARFSQKDEHGPFEWRNLRREGSNSDRSARPFLYYPIFIKEGNIRIPKMSWEDCDKKWVLQEQPGQNEQVVYPNNDQGVEKTWRWGHETVIDSMSEIAVRKDRSGKDYVYYKRRPHEEGVVCISSWIDSKYSATEHGTAIIKELFGTTIFSYPKSLYAVIDAIYVSSSAYPDSVTLDYFAGSGTTAHAVLSLNKKDNGRRKYILIEMGDYFHTIMKPRVEKIVFSEEWQNGKPVSGSTGHSHIFKYQTLEQYEDSLDNIVFRERDGTIKRTLFDFSDYMLNYMLGFETRGSPCRLNIDMLKKPFDYTLRIRRKKLDKDHLKCSSAEQGSTSWWDVKVDLVETFNYLIGLHVQKITSYTINNIYYLVVYGKTKDNGRVTVVWRNSPDGIAALEDDERIITGTILNNFPASMVYINGQTFVKGAQSIEPLFRKLMGA